MKQQLECDYRLDTANSNTVNLKIWLIQHSFKILAYPYLSNIKMHC